MGVITYLPTLYAIVRLLCKYIGRHHAKIHANLPPEWVAPFEVMHTACDAFNVLIGEPAVEN